MSQNTSLLSECYLSQNHKYILKTCNPSNKTLKLIDQRLHI